MNEKNEAEGKFMYEKDTKRHHRFQVITDSGIVGTIYIPKSTEYMPERIVLEYAGRKG